MFNLVMNMVNESNHFRVIYGMLDQICMECSSSRGIVTPSMRHCRTNWKHSIHESLLWFNSSITFTSKPVMLLPETYIYYQENSIARSTRLGFHLGFHGLGRKGREWLYSWALVAASDEGECQQLVRHHCSVAQRDGDGAMMWRQRSRVI